MSSTFDDIVVGAGILGLAHAYHLARRGRKVAVFEKDAKAVGASIRNFGMLWPIGQPAGAMHRLAMQSRETWLVVLGQSGLWHEKSGSLHVARREDELQVLREFVKEAPGNGFDCELLSPQEVRGKSPCVREEGLLGGLWSPTETCVDPREVIGKLPSWLAAEYGVHFQFDCAVTEYDRPRLRAGGQSWTAPALWVCPGDQLHTLYPELLQGIGLVRCKLQMMRSWSYGPHWQLGPMLAGGLTLTHYKAFADCPSLPALRKRVAEELPEYARYGIHVMVSQNGSGELILGDSHEYGADIEPFDNEEIDDLILGYLMGFVQFFPNLHIASRWHGTYVKHPTDPYVVVRPAPGVTVVTGVGGAGMTLSFGIAEQVVRETLGEA